MNLEIHSIKSSSHKSYFKAFIKLNLFILIGIFHTEFHQFSFSRIHDEELNQLNVNIYHQLISFHLRELRI